ncbi:ferredoxin-type protein NapF [Thalassotalea atypica]|uniref:ferredoxin-type protein NapF n=1 Tax=Thalassotalea atypica TaxID=2054316 RepID=UPI0025727400|nr:ferredoxin-type protein NapF [Thalassotalea atypica]
MEELANPARRRLFRGKVSSKPQLRLPWVKSERDFLSQCTQCKACIDNCETNIIVKDDLGYPKVDFSQGECTDCKKCIEVCEQPLFKSDAEIASCAPWPINFKIEKSCLALNQIYCQSCKDACDTRAIEFNFLDSSIPSPSLNNDDCSQCGACIEVCPQSAIKYDFNVEK